MTEDALTSPSREELLGATAMFWWDLADKFLLETPYGTWLWSDPEFGGNNTLTKFSGGLKDFSTMYWEGFDPVPIGQATLADKANDLTLLVYSGGNNNDATLR